MTPFIGPKVDIWGDEQLIKKYFAGYSSDLLHSDRSYAIYCSRLLNSMANLHLLFTTAEKKLMI